MGGEGKPGCAFGPHRGGENQSVSVGPSPLHETRTKNRRSTTDWKTRIDHTRIGMEQLKVRPHCSYPFWCSAIYQSWPIHCAESITPRCVSAKNACIFYRTLTFAVSRARKLKRGTRLGRLRA